jgi:pimeloyl-ACP methyl ester carboxylesterase
MEVNVAIALHESSGASTVAATRLQLRPGRLEVAAGVGGIALAILVGLDGSPVWQAVRVFSIGATTAGLLVALVRGSARWRGRLAVLAGVPAVAIAVGFSPHWAKGGPLPIRGSAALLAAAGLTLVTGGTAVATRERRWWRRVGAILVVLVATGMVTFIAAQAVAATNVPKAEIGATPASVGLEYADVALRTSDGVDLAGWYVESSNRAAVVLLHGAGSTRSNVLDEAATLAAAGFGVLMVDARGHGESDGRAMDFGWHGDADIAAATAYLATRSDVDRTRIGAVGMSMGGEEAVGASGGNQLIRAVVAEGASARNAADEAWLSEQYGARGALQEQIERVQDWITDVLTSASVPSSLRDGVEASGDTRYLLITAGRMPNEADSATHVAAGAPDRVATWNVPGAGHTGGLATAPDEWRDRVVGFLSAVLLGQ